jgi:hypothetical protein
MLKMVTGFVLGSKISSTYPRGYASGLFLPAALPNDHFEHPTAKGYSRYRRLPSFLQPKPELKRFHDFRVSAIAQFMVTAHKKRLPAGILLP